VDIEDAAQHQQRVSSRRSSISTGTCRPARASREDADPRVRGTRHAHTSQTSVRHEDVNAGRVPN
jgi:hypothetical protein